jgi:ATP-dependent DNA ligase
MSTIFEEVELGIKGGYFTPPKPKNEQDDEDRKLIAHLESTNNLMIQRKHDGNGHIATIGKKSREIDIYTLGLNSAAEKYPHLVRDLGAARFPGRTLLCSEIFCTVGGVHNRYEATRLTTSSVTNALAFQRTQGLYPTIALFNTLIWNGEDATRWSNHDRYHCIFDHLKRVGSVDHVQMTELIEMSLEEARKMSRKNAWEGLVLYDRNASTQFALGKVGKIPTIPRPPGVWKDKEGLEVDFVAYDFVRSTAKSHADSVKDFYIGLIDPVTGELIPCGKCGNGLSREDRFKFVKTGMLPVAVEVKFEQWSKHGKTLLGRIERVRDHRDKHFTQCIATQAQLEKFLAKERIKVPW